MLAQVALKIVSLGIILKVFNFAVKLRVPLPGNTAKGYSVPKKKVITCLDGF